MSRPRGPRSRRFPLVLLGIAALGLSGCVERRYTIRTNPPGAIAFVNGEELGPTPVSSEFVYYGHRDITLVKDGYQTERFVQPIRAPWWDNLLTEFFTENLIPATFRDERDFTYQLKPLTVPAESDLTNRAEVARSQGNLPPPRRQGGILGWLGF